MSTKILYHVTTVKKLMRYKKHGHIQAPVRAWKRIEDAVDFSCRTSRRVILRLKDDGSFVQLFGHKGNAVVSYQDYSIEDF